MSGPLSVRCSTGCASACFPAHLLSGALHLPHHIAPAAVKLFSHARPLPRRRPRQPRAGHCQQHFPWGGNMAGGPATHLCLQQQDSMLQRACVGLHDGARGQQHSQDLHCTCRSSRLMSSPGSAAAEGCLCRCIGSSSSCCSRSDVCTAAAEGSQAVVVTRKEKAALPRKCDMLHRTHVGPHDWVGCSLERPAFVLLREPPAHTAKPPAKLGCLWT